LVLAFLVSLVGVWLNDVAVSWGRDGMARVVIESVEEIAYTRLRQQGAYSAKQFAINVKDVVDDKLINPIISFQGGDDELPTTITCEEATMKTDRAENTLTLTCRNGTIDSSVGSMAFPDTPIERVISLDDASRKGGGTRSTSDMPMCVIPEEKIAQRGRIQTLQQQLAAKAAYQMIAGDFTALSAIDWNRNDRQLIEAQQRLYRLEMEPHRRWANGFSCLCFVALGVPLAIRRRNADFLTSFFMCFLPILILYYPLLMFGVSQAKSGTFPPWGVWAGNAILLLVGWHSIRKVCRY
jgi:lipopolysaccharide export system permease protein